MSDVSLSLKDALCMGRLDEFISQEDARGVGPIDRAEFDRAADRVIKAPQPADQTSRFASGDDLSEMKTPRDTDPYAAG